MKPLLHTFRKTVRLFQVFRSINQYGKTQKSFEDRKEKLTWKPIESNVGYVKNGDLFLPDDIIAHPKFENCNLILLLDDLLPEIQSVAFNHEKNHCFHLPGSSKLDIFHFKQGDEIELHFKYGYFEVGAPKREDFKLADLKKNQTISVKINGKIDLRRPRLYQEQKYIFDYIGDFQHCFLVKDPRITKSIPKPVKLIDLSKRLW